ncbi:MAG: hypothetical protein ACYDH4_09975 [Candidatus Cryosericum sp.]
MTTPPPKNWQRDEAILKELMTQIWNAGGYRLSVAVCVDEAIRIAKERDKMEIPAGWRENFIRAASEALNNREKPAEELPVIVTKTTQAEFEAELAKHRKGQLKVVRGGRRS